MGAMASQTTSLTIVYPTFYSGADQRKHQSSVSLAFVRGIHRSQVNSPHEWPLTRKMFPYDDVIMASQNKFDNNSVYCWIVNMVIKLDCLGNAGPALDLWRKHWPWVNVRQHTYLPVVSAIWRIVYSKSWGFISSPSKMPSFRIFLTVLRLSNLFTFIFDKCRPSWFSTTFAE